MSKCGYCGFEGNFGEHLVLRCKATLTDETKERINKWLAKEKDLADITDIKEAESIMNEIKERYDGIL